MPLKPRRGPDGRWIPPLPDPKPPDDQGVCQGAHAAASVSETPVTAGGIVITDVSPRRRMLGPPVSSTASEISVRPARDDGYSYLEYYRTFVQVLHINSTTVQIVRNIIMS